MASRTADTSPEPAGSTLWTSPAAGHVPELDGIRGFAVLMVLIWHLWNCQIPATAGLLATLEIPSQLFWSGVDLFFVLSGFLIGGILLDHAEKRGFYTAFYMRRAARILPVYVVLLAAYFLGRALLDPERFGYLFHNPLPDWGYLTFTQNLLMARDGSFGPHFLGVTWSLAVEEQFYLFVPALLMALGSARFVRAACLLAVAAPLLRLTPSGFAEIVATPFRMDSLFAGVLLARAVRHPAAVRWMLANRATLWGLFGLLTVGMALMTRWPAGREGFEPSFLAAYYALLIALAVLHRGERVTAVWRWKPLTLLGLYSYGIYMYHMAVTGLMHGTILGEAPAVTTAAGAAVTLGSLVVTLLLAATSYHLYEEPIRRLGRRFTYKEQASEGTAPALSPAVEEPAPRRLAA
ncbi:acyltransferase family protein [Alienimonas californiensis]|uniref:O-acetyltransferase OatA n=1 Tax=Alienimonas californiensis TaxID=2527989 RepID=A0A517PBX4_9PLAN|nr:acyltransferase [Alienimonas californiensis]QDT16866.1 O-acetyltransferase OatA [Alienimonas californiensis]